MVTQNEQLQPNEQLEERVRILEQLVLALITGEEHREIIGNFYQQKPPDSRTLEGIQRYLRYLSRGGERSNTPRSAVSLPSLSNLSFPDAREFLSPRYVIADRASDTSLLQFSEKLAQADEQISELKRDRLEILRVLSDSRALAAERFRRVAPATIYLDISDSEAISAVESAVRNLVSALGLEVLDEDPPVWGSWLKQMFVRSQAPLTREDLQQRFGEAVAPVPAAADRHTQLSDELTKAKIALAYSEAILNVQKALDPVDEGIISVGPLFSGKYKERGKPTFFAVVLTEEQMELEKNNPDMRTSLEAFNRVLRESREKDVFNGDAHQQSMSAGQHAVPSSAPRSQIANQHGIQSSPDGDDAQLS